MIAEVATVCVTTMALYGMRLYEARVRDRTEAALLRRLATTAEVDQLRSEVETLRASIATTSGRVDHLAMRR
jgi:type II secretory pathway component PulM